MFINQKVAEILLLPDAHIKELLTAVENKLTIATEDCVATTIYAPCSHQLMGYSCVNGNDKPVRREGRGTLAAESSVCVCVAVCVF